MSPRDTMQSSLSLALYTHPVMQKPEARHDVGSRINERQSRPSPESVGVGGSSGPSKY